MPKNVSYEEPVGPSPSVLRPIRPSRNLTDEIVERIAGEISSGRLPIGAKLPTEQEMMAGMGVSRTVVREAVSALRARGLVTTRQGAGAFVAEAQARPYVINPDGLGSLDSVIEILELRSALEVEAAALAAERASPAERKAVRTAHATFCKAIDKGERGVNEDFAFHRAIAQATGNLRFVEFLEFLGRYIIPRQTIRTEERAEEAQRAYLERIRDEHELIASAIDKKAPEQAREAMRAHLSNSAARYRLLSRKRR